MKVEDLKRTGCMHAPIVQLKGRGSQLCRAVLQVARQRCTVGLKYILQCYSHAIALTCLMLVTPQLAGASL